MPIINVGSMILTSFCNALFGTLFQGIATQAYRPLNQKLESTGFFNLDAKDVIGQYGENLVQKAKDGKVQEVSGREKEIDELISELRKGTNPCIVGKAGVGKTALVEGLAVKIAKGEVPDDIKNWEIIKVDFPSLIVGKGYGSESNSGLIRLRALFEYAKKHPNIVIFIDEVHQFANFADLCKTYLDRNQIKLVGATTLKEFSMYLSKDEALQRRFKRVFVEEPDIQTSFNIAKARVSAFEKRFNVKVNDSVLYINSLLTARYLPYRPSPDKEIKNLEAACEIASRESTVKPKEKDSAAEEKTIEVTETHIRQALTLSSHIPVNVPSSQEFAKLVTMSARFKSALIGQDEAVDTVCEVIKRARLEMNDPERMRGSFLFAGPSGVGKTYLAKMIGSEIEKNLFIDASQFNGEMRKELIDIVKNNPYCEIVFDGIEKAKPAVVSDIISIIDSGFMLDNAGTKVDFKNTVIVLTANTGKEAKTKEEMKKFLIDKLGIEVMSKVDNVLMFNTLSEEAAKKLALSSINNICNILSSRFGVKVECNEEIAKLAAKEGLASGQGANGITKYIYNNIFNVLTQNITNGSIKPKQTVTLKADNNKIAFDIAQTSEKAKDSVDAKNN